MDTACEPRTETGTETTLRVLLVEDDPSIAEPLAEGLEHEGFEVQWVATGADALAAEAGDVVLLDLGLPDLDGREVCRRSAPDRSKVPIIVVTARDDEIDRVLVLEMAADDYVVKPFGSASSLPESALFTAEAPRSRCPSRSMTTPVRCASTGADGESGSTATRSS